MDSIKELVKFAKLAQKYKTLNRFIDWTIEQDSTILKSDVIDFIKKLSDEEM